MELAKLIQDIQAIEVTGNPNPEIRQLVYDSRQVKEGSLFICVEGFKFDGHDFIARAVQNGARAVVIEKELSEYLPGVTYIRVKDTREAMSYLARTFYNYPLEDLNLIGVTGTNGKTTTTYLIKAVLERAGVKTGLIGTIKNIIGEKTLPATRTTPESLDLWQLFAAMVEAGITHAVMEVSSHALDLKRVVGMEFKLAVFTNISQDHLDYHQTLAEYLKAKSLLFTQVEPGGFSLVNADDRYCREIIRSSRGRVITYSIENQSDLRAREIELTPRGVSFQLQGAREFSVDLNLTGLFNIYNSLAAAAAGHALGLEDSAIREGLEGVAGVPGRFELVDAGQTFAVVVDYAHTPDGMENVLKTAREFVRGRLITVFGCGGDRDKGKRPLMGKVGAEYADYIFLTSDNPRSEDPLEIIAQIEGGIREWNEEKGAEDAGESKGRKGPGRATEGSGRIKYQVVPDRKEAIFSALEQAREEDMVIIFGKGHETYQIFREKTIPFDDREVAREALEQKIRGGRP